MEGAVEPRQPADDPRRLRAQELRRVGVLLLGHDARARCEAIGDLAEPELVARPQHDLGAELGEVHPARGRGADEVEHEVAVRHSVHRVLDDALEAELARYPLAVGVEVHAGQRAGPERQPRRRLEAELEPLLVAREAPEVGEQVVAQVDGLRALEVRVAGHRPVDMAVGDVGQRAHQVLDLVARSERVRAHEHRDVGGHLVVARAGGVQLAARPVRRSRSRAARSPCARPRRRAGTRTAPRSPRRGRPRARSRVR